ncbi:MAG: MMPL family transporter [Demequina sp.]|nr:MMPL family transporter [Demequina sp.]
MTRIALTFARISSRKPWLTLGLWLMIAVGLIASASAIGNDYSDEISVPGSDSAIANELLSGAGDGSSSSLLLASPDGFQSVDAAALVDDVIAAASAALDVDIPNPLDNPEAAVAKGQFSADGRALSIPVAVGVDDVSDAGAAAALKALEPALDAGWSAAYSGEFARSVDANTSHRSEAIGIVAAVVVLSISLGSLAAMVVPVVSGLVAVTSGLGLLGLLSHATAIPEISPTLATMIGLGVGIDYALFQVARLKQALNSHPDTASAVATTAASAGTAAAFAGATVAVSICALAISGVSFVGWLGYASAIVVAIVVASALTFTPAFLTVLAPRLTPSSKRHVEAGKGTARLAAAAVRHPWRATVSALLVLGTLAVPTASLHLGMSGPGDRALDTQLRESNDIMTAYFGAGSTATLAVVVQLDSPAAGADDPRLVQLSQELANTDAAAATPLRPRAGDPTVATAQVTPTDDPNASSTRALLDAIRALPTPGSTSLHVGGATATRIDLANQITSRLPWLMAAVVAVSTLMLVIAFRSVLIPLKAAVLNLISVAASYGVVVAVFQWGWGTSLIGLDGPVVIDSYVPMILFTVLFGLSTDYEVFLISSMREAWNTTHDAKAAIVEGTRNSGRVIMTAAIIMISVFLSFVMQDDPIIKVFGLGLAASILFDATIVRMLLVPALMSLIGRHAWWVPAWLDRILPSIDVHGETDETSPRGRAAQKVSA